MAKRRKKAARQKRPQRIAPGFGQFVYEAMVCQRRKGGEAWTAPDLAKATGKQVATVRGWFRGTVPEHKSLKLISQALDVAFSDLSEATLASDLTDKSRECLVRLYRDCVLE